MSPVTVLNASVISWKRSGHRIRRVHSRPSRNDPTSRFRSDIQGRRAVAALASVARDAEASVTQSLGVPRLDLTDEICSADACGPVIGDTLVYRDAHHLTATFSAELSGALGAQLASALDTSIEAE